MRKAFWFALAEPSAPADAPRYHVVLGDGGGSGSEDGLYRGLEVAQARARPGDAFLLGTGVCEGTFAVSATGEPGQPIVWRHAVQVENTRLCAKGVMPPDDETQQFPVVVNDLRLRSGSTAIDAGDILPGLGAETMGAAPDLGAYELGAELPH